jgi:glycosyltransferase involved in cell wall biosynthesis
VIRERSPRVSVVIIVRDGERFIGEAIDSVTEQEGVEWELIVVDDGSTDGTEAIVRSKVASSSAPIRLLHHAGHANLGKSASRNLGIAEAQGEYVAFLDGDDMFLPGKLAEQARILDAEPETAMVYGRTLIWYSWDPAPRRQDRFYPLGVRANATYPAGRLFRLLLENKYQTPTTCNAMVRRSALEAVGGFDEKISNLFEDQLLFGKLLLLFPTHVSDRCWARYRQHEASTMCSATDRQVLDTAHRHYLTAMYDFARRSGLASVADLAALARAMMRIAWRMAKHRTKTAAAKLFKLSQSAVRQPRASVGD